MAREIPFLGRTIVVRQLTVREVTEFFDGAGEVLFTTADLLMNRTLPAKVVCTATGLRPEDLAGEVTPSELVGLWEAVEAENPSFLQALERLGVLGQRAARIREGASALPPASLPAQDTAPA